MNRIVANAAIAAALAMCGCSMFDNGPKAAFERNLAPWGAFAFISPADGLPEGDCHAAAFSKTYVNRSGVKRATVWATALGWFVFGEWPVQAVLLGSLIVIASGIYVILREQQLGLLRKETREAGPSRSV